MKSLVIYATTSGNTATVATAIADALRARGAVELLTADRAPSTLPPVDLVVVGGPTEGHTMTASMRGFLERLEPSSVRATAAAAFDTRVNWPRLLSGSAAVGIAKKLTAAGARIIRPPESFIVTTKPQLEAGEVDRAAAWAGEIAEVVEASLLAPAAG